MTKYFKQTLRSFQKSTDGATAIEYGLIAALISVAIITALNLLGIEIIGVFTDILTGLQKRTSP